jgi:hypothetical protein
MQPNKLIPNFPANFCHAVEQVGKLIFQNKIFGAPMARCYTLAPVSTTVMRP